MARELYNNGGIRIAVSERGTDCHNLVFQFSEKRQVVEARYSVLLQRGVLRELATSPLEDVGRKLETVSGGLAGTYLSTNGISVERVALALAQARIRELEDEVSYHIGSAIDNLSDRDLDVD